MPGESARFAQFPQPAAHPGEEPRMDGAATEDAAHFHGSPEPLPARRAVARISRPGRSATQSGTAHTGDWILELEPGTPLTTEPLMGWSASTDPLRQVCLRFPSRDAAIAFAEKEGWACEVAEPADRPRLRPKSYADNFRWQGERPPEARTSLPGGLPAAKGG